MSRNGPPTDGPLTDGFPTGVFHDYIPRKKIVRCRAVVK